MCTSPGYDPLLSFPTNGGGMGGGGGSMFRAPLGPKSVVPHCSPAVGAGPKGGTRCGVRPDTSAPPHQRAQGVF